MINKASGELCKFRPSSGDWDTVGPVPATVIQMLSSQGYFSVLHGGHLYIFEGGTRNGQSYSVATGEWKALPPLLTARGLAAACVVDGRLCVVGGCDGNQILSSAEEYIAAEQRWQSLPDTPLPVAGAAAVEWQGKLLVIGGYVLRGASSAAVQEYDLVSRNWRQLPSLIDARVEPAAVVFGGDVMVMGGYEVRTGQWQPLRTVERYNRQSQCWEAMPSMTEALYWPQGFVVNR